MRPLTCQSHHSVALWKAKRRRERRLRQWHRHERPTVQMALCEALHHAAPQMERGENSAPRGQKTHKAGGRRRVLKEPEPPVEAVRAASPRTAVSSLATPSLAETRRWTWWTHPHSTGSLSALSMSRSGPRTTWSGGRCRSARPSRRHARAEDG